MNGKTTRQQLGRARIGLFTHYTFATYPTEKNYGGTKRSQNDMSEAKNVEEAAALFDAEKYAEAAHDMGAQYVVFTVCHAGFNLLFPSETMLKRGVTQKCSQTDVPGKLLDALGRYDIPLILYMPPNDDHDLTETERQEMGWTDGDARESFINELLCEIGQRYNGRIAGFWFDQGGPRASAKDAVRKYNPDAAVFINTGVTANDIRHPLSDFTVSEYYGTFQGGDSDDFPVHFSQVNRIFGGQWWANGGQALTDARNLYRYMVRTIAVEGQLNCGINYACGPYLDQSWETGVRELMHDFGELVRRNSYAIYDTLPGSSYPTKSGSTLSRSDWGVSTESADGKKVYLHVLNLPADGVLIPGKTADGRVFSRAYLGNGESALGFDGERIILPENCDAADTVLTLE